MKRICFVLTVEFAVKAFMVEHLKKLSQEFDVSLIVNTKNPNLLNDLGIKGNLIPLKIAREINLWSDISSLFYLIKYCYQYKFDLVHTITPKAGLLGILAASVNRTKFRVHTFQGEVWLTKKGLLRILLKVLDKLVAKLSTHIIVVSNSEQDFLIANSIIDPKKSIVFRQGSIAGVNIKRFKPDNETRQSLRQSLKVKDADTLILYIGRLNKDKGIIDLVNAFTKLESSNCHLLIVGPDEHELSVTICRIIKEKYKQVHIYPETKDPERFMTTADILCLPSYREGFGSVIIEAAACGIPALASRIYGITDAIVENETGLLHEPKNVDEIAEKLQYLIENPNERKRLGKNAYERVLKDFDSKLITQAWFDFYKDLLQ